MSVIARKALALAALVSLASVGVVSVLQAQPSPNPSPELIVRASSSASAAFVDRLRSPMAKQGPDSLLAGVVSSTSVLASPATPTKQSGEETIPAFTLTVQDSTAERAVESSTVSVNAEIADPSDFFAGVAEEASTGVDDTTPAKRESGPCLAIGVRRRSTNAAGADDDARTISSGDGLGEGWA